ncbi:MAG: PHP domain-containing protein [Ruminiclostridium sp.]|jgi:predicted metal-dependent phosphoesterase TrpH|nr:PHP domain-containing protein [Ruminiclostridium sp.]MCI9467516.1 PHP domain-containing protein [Ruminiclostridium sp.]
MIFTADLHTHSTASDGQYTPTQLVGLAKDKGLQLLALTDHDTLDGLEEAVQAGEALGLRVLRGVELSAKEHHNFHILGYGFGAEAPGLKELCDKLRDGRDDRKYRILAYLKEKGMELTLEEVEELAGGDIIARPHFARAMVRRGYVASNREAFDRFLDTKEYQIKVPRFKADAKGCIDAIKAAGGKTSLAHPYQMRLPDGELETLVAELAGYGLDAIEGYYPKYSPEQQAFYHRLARQHGLHLTGGSDFHGEKVKPEVKLGAVELELDWLVG